MEKFILFIIFDCLLFFFIYIEMINFVKKIFWLIYVNISVGNEGNVINY